MRPQATCRGPKAQGLALERAPYGADWPDVAYDADVIFAYVSEPHEPGHYFVQLLAHDACGNEVGRKKLGDCDQ